MSHCAAASMVGSKLCGNGPCKSSIENAATSHRTVRRAQGQKKTWEWQCSSEHSPEQFQTIWGHVMKMWVSRQKKGQKVHPNFAPNITMEFHHHLSAPNHKSQIASDLKSRSPNRKNFPQIAVSRSSNRTFKSRDLWFEPLFKSPLESQCQFLLQQVRTMSFSDKVHTVANR